MGGLPKETLINFDYELVVKTYRGKYYITIDDVRIGHGFRNKRVAQIIAKWLSSAMDAISRVFCKTINDYYKEQESA